MNLQNNINKAIKILQSERYMREVVFKNKPEKRDKKVAEMDFVINTILQLKKGYDKLLDDYLNAENELFENSKYI